MRATFIDHTGQRFERLAVIARAPNVSGRTLWACRCDCGTLKTVQAAHLRSGAAKSCGCLRIARMATGEIQKLSARNTTHGMTNSREFSSWSSMRERCANPHHRAWKWYGGKGVRVCDRWTDFANFLTDMGLRPDGCELDRIDPAKNYEPTNCRWLLRRENSLRALHSEREHGG